VKNDELFAALEARHPPHPLLVELETHAACDGVRSISRTTGRFLSVLVTAMQANRILEVGTGCGYSTLWMALAQPTVGKIWTIESDLRLTDIARSYFRRAAEDDYIEVFNTPAPELLENFPHRNLDIVFVAANEGDYSRYLQLIVPMLKLSGLAIFDDCLREPDFAEHFLTHPALDATILPLGIGIGARRK
jgi:caffeoyl-CoA O-methyltransferase